MLTTQPQRSTAQPAATRDWTSDELAELPVVVIGAGPVGLAAAAHLLDRGLRPLVLEVGSDVGAAVSAWGHVRTFTPWKYIVDEVAEKLLAPTGWTNPASSLGGTPPTGCDIVSRYLRPLAAALGTGVVRTGARVVAITKQGLDKGRSLGREQRPFLVRVRDAEGTPEDLLARAVIDASGSWYQPNPLGGSGLPAVGERAAAAAGFLAGPLPDVLGHDRARFSGRKTLVVGMGHSAANTLLDLTQLAREAEDTRIVWAIRAADPSRLYGGGAADQLPEREKLGHDVSSLVASGAIELVNSFSTTGVEIDGDSVTVAGATPDGERRITGVHNVVAATGFRPDLGMLSELRLDLDPGLEAPTTLAPLIDPAFHSCGTVPPHGHQHLSHPDAGFYIAGMKAYGRAPTFLVTTGNEQVRSIAAALAGDIEAADEVQLVLPETGVCSVTGPASDSACCG
ncbi:MAG: NAD(P)-binding protein [Nocardioidaceae bacterium]